jgi:hypothetical protein
MGYNLANLVSQSFNPREEEEKWNMGGDFPGECRD